MATTILVTGFLGAGKSTLMAQLRAALGPEIELVEVTGRQDPAVEAAALGPGPVVVVAVADAVNVAACLVDPLVGPLAAAQLRAAAIVFLSRGDLAPAAPALQAVASVTGAHVIDAPNGVLPPDAADRIGRLVRALPVWAPAAARAELAFAEWEYRGPAVLHRPALEALLAGRAPGLYRMAGEVRVRGGGIEVQIAGRVRQTRAIPEPAETRLLAVGPKARFRPDRMALAFSEAVAASAHLSGMFSHR